MSKRLGLRKPRMGTPPHPHYKPPAVTRISLKRASRTKVSTKAGTAPPP